jgi:hypothetical protein
VDLLRWWRRTPTARARRSAAAPVMGRMKSL